MSKAKYILHGGIVKFQTEENKLYYQEMVKDLSNPTVLLVYFAREDSEVPKLTERDTNNFAWANPGVDIALDVANENEFIEQVKANDVIFFMGGATQKLIDAVERTGIDLKKALEGKIVSGSSAGAYLISKWYYTNSGKEIRQGLGLLPIAVWAHYRPDKGSEYYLSEDQEQVVKETLKARIRNNKLVLLHEQEMLVFEQDER